MQMRSNPAVQKFVDSFKGSFSKVNEEDNYFWIYNQIGDHIAYAIVEHDKVKSVNVKGLRVEAKKLLSLFNKRFNPLVIWELGDGLAYVKARDISGSIAMDAESLEYIVTIDPRKNPVKFIL
jgi:hypothetical protein